MFKTLSVKAMSILLLMMFMMVSVMISREDVFAEKNDFKSHSILLISSVPQDFESFYKKIEGIKSVIDAAYIPMDIEFIGEDNAYNYAFIHNRLNKRAPYSAVVATDDKALRFVHSNRESLFKDVPLVFTGIKNELLIKASLSAPLCTGVLETIDIESNLKNAVEWMPHTSRFVSISSSTNMGLKLKHQFLSHASNFPNQTFESLDTSQMTLDAVFQKIGSYEEGTVILLFGLSTDYKGHDISFSEMLMRIRESASVPVFHVYEKGIGEGLLGGTVISYYYQGVSVGSLLLDVLNRTSGESIAQVVSSPNIALYDRERLDYFGIKWSLLPKDTIFVNVPKSPIYKYRWFFIIGLPIFLLQTFFLLFIVHSSNTQRKMQKALIQSKYELMKNNETLEKVNQELVISLEEVELRGKRIHSLVYYDEVTGLHNRYSMTTFLEYALNERNENEQVAVFFFDIDNFNAVNDTYGHDFGDAVLKMIGQALKKYELPATRVGRFGGDEFMIILKGENIEADVMSLIQGIKQLFDGLVVYDNHTLYLSVSIGVTKAPDHGNTVNTMIKKADLALFEAKKLGKNRHVFYSDDLERQITSRMPVQTALKEAFSNREFYVVYQPYFDLESNTIVGFEALLRWDRIKTFDIGIQEMIACIEGMGMIVEVGDWVMTEACAFIQRMNKASDRTYTVSVNVSPVQLLSIGFTERLVQLLQIYQIKPEYLCLEMTETVMIQSLEKGVNILNHLKNQKFKIAIDDFGTGYSSLKYFKLLPMDILKLDKSFIDQVESSVYDKNLVQAMVNLSHQKGITVIAEGVETERQRKVLIDLGCDRGQGYLRSKPVLEENIIQLLEMERLEYDIIKHSEKLKSEADYEYL